MKEFIVKLKNLMDISKEVKLPQLGVLFLILLISFPILTKDQYFKHLIIQSMIYSCLSMGFIFTGGFIGIVNFGYAAFFGIGAYVAGLFVTKLAVPHWAGLFLGAFGACISGFLLSLLIIRLRGIYATCMCWFFQLAVMAVCANWVGVTNGHSGLSVPLIWDSKDAYYFEILIISILILAGLQFANKSYIGLATRAIGQDLENAQASGVSPYIYKAINFTISCGCAGFVGGFYASFVGILEPKMMSMGFTAEIMLIAYIGGRRSIWGGGILAFLLIPLLEYLRPLMEIRLIIYGTIMILVMIFYPGGFGRLIESMLERLNGISRKQK